MILLDTHAWIWWVDESPKLPEATRQLIDRADDVGIPAICCWELAVLSTRLPGEFHGDPADRLIVASSLTHNALLVTRDEKITDWGMVPVYWR